MFDAIAAAIREQNGNETKYKPAQMAPAILALSWDVGLKLRALLLDDGTLELNYLDGRQTALSGRTITKVYYVDGAGYDAISAVPWKDDNKQIKRVVFDGSLTNARAAGAGITNADYWFLGCANLVEVTGFENLQGLTSAQQMFGSCEALESIYATAFDNTNLDGFLMFSGCGKLVGGTDAYVPQKGDGDSVCKLGAGGVLTAPDADVRQWYDVVLYADGEMVVGVDACADVGTREVLAQGHLCAQAAYREIGALPGYEQRTKVTSLTLDETMANFAELKLDYTFYDLWHMERVTGLGNLSNCTTMRYTFAQCSNLTELDMRGFNADKLTDMTYCFSMCKVMTTIYVSPGFKSPNLTSSGCFYGCKALVGGAGTALADDTDAIGAEYFRVDKGAAEPGYLTELEG